MRIANVLAMALTVMLVVVAAFIARTAEGAEPRPVWVQGLAQPIEDVSIFRRRDGFVEEAARFQGVEGAIGVLRKPGGRLPATRTLAARDADEFLREVARRFAPAGGTAAAYAGPRPMALTPGGNLAAGFVVPVTLGDKRCDFAIAGYRGPATDKIAVMARALVCGAPGALTPADVRLSGLLAHADFSE